jgi:hypothetical protein
MDIEDKELFDSALNDEPIEQVAADEPVIEQPVNDGQPRDDQGRFASKAEPEPVAAEPQGKDEAYVPSWRLREMREEREAVERRFQETQTQWQRQIAELQARLPKDEPKPAPDVFEDPNKFLEYGVRQHVDPIRSEITQLREEYSKKWAEKEHGPEKVKAAYDWVAQGMQSRDPEVAAVYQRAMQSMDPYGEILKAHQQKAVYSQIGNDPNAWFEKELEKRLADPQFASQQLQRIQSGVRAPGTQTPNQIKLPPSIGKVPSSHSASDDVGDMSDAGLFAHAMR